MLSIRTFLNFLSFAKNLQHFSQTMVLPQGGGGMWVYITKTDNQFILNRKNTIQNEKAIKSIYVRSK